MIRKLLPLLRRHVSERLVWLDYPVVPRARYGTGKPPHAALSRLLEGHRKHYEELIEAILARADALAAIPLAADPAAPTEPHWDNGWLMGIDAAALYTLVVSRAPKRLYEVGSGHSTRFARRALRDADRDCELVSIDPEPRVEIDALCDRVVREPLENVDLALFDALEPGDMLFIDSSHYAFANSDVSVIFLELLPRIAAGVWIHFHDIWLPSDYPDRWALRFYNEQYLLATALLASPDAFSIELPARFVVDDPALAARIAPLWERIGIPGIQRRTGGSFWMRKLG